MNARRSDRIVVLRRARDRPPPTPQPTPCRLWQSSVKTSSYGRVTHRGNMPAHRWVVQTAGEDQFGVKWDPDLEVMHLCDNPPCFRFDHLRLGTHAENMADGRAKARIPKLPIQRGPDNLNSKLDEDAARRIRRLAAEGTTQRALAMQFGVSQKSILNLLHGRTWAWVVD